MSSPLLLLIPLLCLLSLALVLKSLFFVDLLAVQSIKITGIAILLKFLMNFYKNYQSLEKPSYYL